MPWPRGTRSRERDGVSSLRANVVDRRCRGFYEHPDGVHLLSIQRHARGAADLAEGALDRLAAARVDPRPLPALTPRLAGPDLERELAHGAGAPRLDVVAQARERAQIDRSRETSAEPVAVGGGRDLEPSGAVGREVLGDGEA